MTSRVVPSRFAPPSTAPSLSPDTGGVDEEWREKIARWTQMAAHIRSRAAQLATAQAHTKNHTAGAANYSMQAQAAPVMLTHVQLAQQAQALKAQIQQIDKEIEAARAEALDDPALLESEQERRMHTIEQHATAMLDLHGHLRTSMLQARAAVERAAVQARNELLGTHDPATAKRRAQQLSGESASDKNAAFSASLLRTRSMLSDEISRSSSALSTLQASTRVLGSTSSEYTTYGGTVAVGRKMITKQLQRERTDRLLLMVGLLFFSLVVVYIVHRRLAPFLFWWTTFLVNKQNAQQTQQPVVTTMPATQIPPVSTQQYYNPASASGAPVYVDPAAAAPPAHVQPAYSDQRPAVPIPAATAAPAATAPATHSHPSPGVPSMPDPASLAQHTSASAAAAAAAASYAPHAHTHPSAGHYPAQPHQQQQHHHHHGMPDPIYAPTQPPPHAHAYPDQQYAGPYGP